MAIRGWSCALLVVATLGCGGEEFQSGSGGTSAGGASSGGTSSGGASGTGATGGVVGTGGEAGSVNPLGGAGGTGGGDGGTGGVVIPGCTPKPGAPLLLHTTLDDATSIQAPATGTPPGTFHGDLVPGKCGGAFEMDTVGDFVAYQADQNINLNTGTLDFYFKPNSPPDGSTRHLLSVPQKLAVVWDGVGNILVAPGGVIARTIPAANVPFAPNIWTRVTITWKFSARGETVFVYFDGNGVGGQFNPGPFTTASVDASPLFFGAMNENDDEVANGTFDDIKIYDGTEEP